jgi:hypothetical protein
MFRDSDVKQAFVQTPSCSNVQRSSLLASRLGVIRFVTRYFMRALKLTIAFVGLLYMVDASLAQQGKNHGEAAAATVEKVLNANPQPDGKLYRIDLQLRGGKRVSYAISPEEATKIADGLSKPAVEGGQEQKVATLVYGMRVEMDSKGLAVVLIPRGRSGTLEPLAIPMAGAEPLVIALQAKIAEAKANAAKNKSPAKQQ